MVLALDPQVPLVEADVGRIRQVLHNLIRNALEAMEEQSNAEIDISTRLATGTGASAVAIEVADNGPGFAESVMEQAFDPYVTSKAKGTGLGLAIVKKLVEEHGGQVRAANMEQGGARISILLPISGGGEALPLGQPDHRRERA
jgi:nitrogen fixation/metabolism regulation signal transduction histidine kinase